MGCSLYIKELKISFLLFPEQNDENFLSHYIKCSSYVIFLEGGFADEDEAYCLACKTQQTVRLLLRPLPFDQSSL